MRSIPARLKRWIAAGICLGFVFPGGCNGTPDTAPRQLSTTAFHYPEDLWDAGVEGETVLEIHVSQEGTVDSASVQRSSGFAAFDSAAINGSHDLLFEPAMKRGEKVPVKVLLPVQFHLPVRDSSAPQPTPP